jgi:hypothetical protein
MPFFPSIIKRQSGTLIASLHAGMQFTQPREENMHMVKRYIYDVYAGLVIICAAFFISAGLQVALPYVNP